MGGSAISAGMMAGAVGGVAAVGAAAIAAAVAPKTFVVHGAQIACKCGSRPGRLIVPLSHGVFIHDTEQLNISDSVPLINVQVFGVCTNPNNPDVKAAAQEIVDNVKSRKKGFMDKVMDFFCKPPKVEVNEDLIKKCVALCKPVINMEWVGGKDDVIIDEKSALLSSCTLSCLYGGEIKIIDDGQRK